MRVGVLALLICTAVTAPTRVAADESALRELLAQGDAKLRDGDASGADILFREAARAAAAEERPDLQHEALVMRLHCAGALRDLVGQRDVCRLLLTLSRERKRPDMVARVGTNLGYLEATLGNFAVALDLLQEQLAYFESGEDVAMRAQVLARMASVQRQRGRHAEALESGERAARIFRLTQDVPSLAETLSVIGNIYQDLGRTERALHMYRKTEELEGEIPGRVRIDLAVNRGAALRQHGRPEKAAAMLEASALDLEADGYVEALAPCLIQLAFAQAESGDPEKAFETFARLTALKNLDPVAAAYADLYLGTLLLDLGRVREAERRLDRTLARADRIEDPHLESAVHGGLARVALEKGDAVQALAAVRRSLDLVDELTAGLAPVASAFGRHQRAGLYRIALRAAWLTGDAEAIFEYVERSRAGVLHRGLGGRDALRQRALPPGFAAEEQVAREQVLAANARFRSAMRSGELPALRASGAERSDALLAYDAVLDRIQRSAAAGAHAAFPSRARLSDVEQSLAPTDALVLYSLANERARAMLITHGGHLLVDLGCASKDVVANATALVDAARSDADTEELAAKAGAQLIEPLEIPEGTERLLVSPDGPLAYLPFALVVEDMPVALVPSASVYLLLRGLGLRRGEGILALGDPDYGGTRGGTAAQVYAGGMLGRIAKTADEVRAITSSGDEILLLGDATEEAFRLKLVKETPWRSVHLACHGLVNDDHPSLTALAFAAGETSDGFLTVNEVFGMRIPTDLAVLSACDTGLGKTLAADGVLGLTQAFLYAGARQVIASSWKVPDKATMVLMERFYELWTPPAQQGSPGQGPHGRVEGPEGEGLPAAEALREAQAFVRNHADHPEWRHARYWAAWSVWGP